MVKNTCSKPVVFIAGPMTGKPNYNRDEFNAEAQRLEQRGCIVLNPAVFPDGLAHHQYLAMTLVMLEQADAIYLLDGWENSVGAKAEVIRAKELNLLFFGQSWEVILSVAAFRSNTNASIESHGSCNALDVGGILHSPMRPGSHNFSLNMQDN